MRDPKRWLDDEGVAPELQQLLARAPRARGLDSAARSRARLRVLKVSAIPMTAAAWLTLKSAAAFIAATTATAAVTVMVTESAWQKPPDRPVPAPREVRPQVNATAGRPAPPAPPAADPEPVAEVQPAPRPTQRFSDPRREQATDLEAESRQLERARLALATAPTESLRLAEDHRARFPRSQLTQERELIEIEALYRLGRNGQARDRAQRLLSLGARGLYAERLKKLLDEIQ